MIAIGIMRPFKVPTQAHDRPMKSAIPARTAIAADAMNAKDSHAYSEGTPISASQRMTSAASTSARMGFDDMVSPFQAQL